MEFLIPYIEKIISLYSTYQKGGLTAIQFLKELTPIARGLATTSKALNQSAKDNRK